MVHPTLDLSERIKRISSLEKDQFDPEQHLADVRVLVKRLAKPRFFPKLTDLVTLEGEGVSLREEVEAVGEFRLRQRPALYYPHLFGFSYKVDIRPWRRDIMDTAAITQEGLLIGYTKARQPTFVAKYEEKKVNFHFPEVFLLTNTFISVNWCYNF